MNPPGKPGGCHAMKTIAKAWHQSAHRMLFDEGRTVADVARILGVLYRPVYDYACVNGWKSGMRRGMLMTRPGHPVMDPLAVQRMAATVTVREIARIYGVTRARVYQALDPDYRDRRRETCQKKREAGRRPARAKRGAATKVC